MEPTLLPAVTVSRRAVVSLFRHLRDKGQSDPLPTYQQLMGMGEVIQAPWGGYLVTTYPLCHEILRSKDWKVPDLHWRKHQDHKARWSAFSSLQMGLTLPMLNPPSHTVVRKSLGNPFDGPSLENFRSSVKAAVTRLLDRFVEKVQQGPADFSSLVSEELPVITIGEWMGLPADDFHLLRSWTHDQANTQELFPSPSQLVRSDDATAQLRDYFTELIRKRREKPGDDPVSSWLHTWDEIESDRVRVDETVRSLALFMILAALETTSYVLSSTVRLLLDHPDQLDSLRRDPEGIPAAVEEALRYDPPIHMISRVASADTEIGGVLVREGELVQLMIGAAHHDPDQYPDPRQFTVGRMPSHLSFGWGNHYCLGNALARMEATELLAELLRRPLRLRISSPPQWEPRTVFRRMTSLPLALA
ncbi:cytochrome P450 [Streptomyces sp. NPDC000941]